MTIFRSRLIDPASVTYQFVSANDPDIIGVEVMFDGNVLIDVSMDADGKTSVLFDADGGEVEFEIDGLRSILEKCEVELKDWRERLRSPGELWSDS